MLRIGSGERFENNSVAWLLLMATKLPPNSFISGQMLAKILLLQDHFCGGPSTKNFLDFPSCLSEDTVFKVDRRTLHVFYTN
jgi:hypothetical protein